MSEPLQTTAIERGIEAYQERLERELHAAWRADYKYCYECVDRTEQFTPWSDVKLIPSNHARPPVSPLRYIVTRYDLESVSIDEFREAIEDE